VIAYAYGAYLALRFTAERSRNAVLVRCVGPDNNEVPAPVPFQQVLLEGSVLVGPDDAASDAEISVVQSFFAALPGAGIASKLSTRVSVGPVVSATLLEETEVDGSGPQVQFLRQLASPPEDRGETPAAVAAANRVLTLVLENRPSTNSTPTNKPLCAPSSKAPSSATTPAASPPADRLTRA
jgi:hypothetical protein